MNKLMMLAVFGSLNAVADTYRCESKGQTVHGAAYTTIDSKVSIDEPKGTFSIEVTEKTLPQYDQQVWGIHTNGAIPYQKKYSTQTGKVQELWGGVIGNSFHVSVDKLKAEGTTEVAHVTFNDCDRCDPQETHDQYNLFNCKQIN